MFDVAKRIADRIIQDIVSGKDYGWSTLYEIHKKYPELVPDDFIRKYAKIERTFVSKVGHLSSRTARSELVKSLPDYRELEIIHRVMGE